jgi:hypothetical protein
MALCDTCGGKGRKWRSINTPMDAHYYPCPAGCVPVKVWHCAVPESSCMDQCNADQPHDPELLRIGGEPGYCNEVTEYHDPATVLLWCGTHDSSQRHGADRCDWSIASDSRVACDIVVLPMPTETLGI